MRPIALLPVGAVLLGIGVATGLVLASFSEEPAALIESDVLVRTRDGDVRTYTAESAAARIESLESLLRRLRARNGAREEDPLGGFEDAAADAESLLPAPPLLRTDGRPYTNDELRALARGSKDEKLRAAAIRALRRVDSDDARTTLQAILADGESSAEIRLLAAQALARAPNRDHLPAELIAAMATETDPDIRRVLAGGVASLRERGAWMREIAGMLGEETDAEVRRALLGAVARSARDPAARQELLGIATSPGADPEERSWALGALTRGRPDRETIAALRPLLADRDPAVRVQALRVLTGDRGMPLATLREGLTDTDASVRATALWRGMNHFGRLAKDKKTNKGALNGVAQRAATLATSDPDAGVRRAGIVAARNLPKKLRERVLASGRKDADLAVRLSAYASSSRKVAKEATPEFLGALSSPDAGLRDYAYQQLRRLHDVRIPFQGGWNPDARAAAIDEIRAAVGGAAVPPPSESK